MMVMVLTVGCSLLMVRTRLWTSRVVKSSTPPQLLEAEDTTTSTFTHIIIITMTMAMTGGLIIFFSCAVLKRRSVF